MNYFINLSTAADIKVHYSKLCMVHHPDRGGDTAVMQVINAQYHLALSRCDGQAFKGTDDKQHTYRYYRDIEQAVMDKIAEIMSVGMIGIEIMLIGSWIWVTGNTRRYSKLLGKNGLKLRWHPKRLAWYWHLKSKRKYHFNAHVDLDDLAASYGYRKFHSERRKPLG